MSRKLLENTSFQLIRTNPKLSTNIKLVYDGNDMFLESFSANEQLSESKFKSFKISGNSTYNQDVYNFYENGKFPIELAYDVYQQFENTTVLSSYDNQYEMFYSTGTVAVNSNKYAQDLRMFAPIWLNKDIPDYFVIFRLDEPVSVNNVNVNNQNANINFAQSPDQFKKNVLDKATAIKTYSLKENSNIGSYLRKYIRQKGFPNAPLSIKTSTDDPISWNGISYKTGGFVSAGSVSYNDLITQDSTIINNEYFFTKGFQRNGVICANLINLEFLFNDADAEDFSINRYFGLYVNAVDEGSFKLSNKINSITERTQSQDFNGPLEILNDSRAILKNKSGVLLELDYQEIITNKLNASELSKLDSLYFIKDKNDEFISVKPNSNWKENQVRIQNTKLDLNRLKGFNNPIAFANGFTCKCKGKSSLKIKVLGQIPQGAKFIFRDGNKFIGEVSSDATLNLNPGTNLDNLFNGTGDPKDIAISIRNAINNGIARENRLFEAGVDNDTVYLKSFRSGSRFNRLNVEFNWNEFDLNIETLPISNTQKLKVHFIGGGDVKSGRLTVLNGDENKFTPGLYIKSKTSYAKILGSSPYLEEPVTDNNGNIIKYNNIDTYYTIYADKGDLIINEGQVSLYKEFIPNFGRFSIYPVKDFDFDFYSKEYSDTGELGYEESYYKNNVDDPDIFEFYNEGGFANLLGILKPSQPNADFDVNIESEYDRLEENYLTSQAGVSRTVPYISKWRFKNGLDVRNKPYRLNLSEAFTLNNFAPSKYEYNQNPFGFTHEWYYLSKLPSYFSDEAIKKSWSYFNEQPVDSIQADPIFQTPFQPGTFQNVSKDNFTDYFIVDKLKNADGVWINLDRQIRYTTFSGGNSDSFASTFFRGVKVLAKPRTNKIGRINFNAKSDSYVRNGEFNDYKFAAILVLNHVNKPVTEIKFVKNEKWKTLTMMIFLTLDYDCLINNGSIDRTLLYSLINEVRKDSLCLTETNKIIEEISSPGIFGKITDTDISSGLFYTRREYLLGINDWTDGFGEPITILQEHLNNTNDENPIIIDSSNWNNSTATGQLTINAKNIGWLQSTDTANVNITIEISTMSNITQVTSANSTYQANRKIEIINVDIINQGTSYNQNNPFIININLDKMLGLIGPIESSFEYAVNQIVQSNITSSAYEILPIITQNITETPIYSDGIMRGAISLNSSGIWSDNPNPSDTKYEIIGIPDINGQPTRFLEDIVIDETGKFTDISFSFGNDIYIISGISRIISNTILIASQITRNGQILTNFSGELSSLVARSLEYKTISGGFKKYAKRLQNISFASILDAVNVGNPAVKYETITADGNPVLNSDGSLAQTFAITLVPQQDILKSVYIETYPDQSKPTQFNLIDIIGFDLGINSSPRLVPIARHTGDYEPIFKDLFFFKDPYLDLDFSDDMNTNSSTNLSTNSADSGYTSGTGSYDTTYQLSKNNSTYNKKDVYNLMRYKNTQFDLSNPKLGIINNLFYHKVNPNNATSVLELSKTTAFKSLYPLINEIGIDYRDFYLFSSNWDPGYFKLSVDKFITRNIIGTVSMKEKKSLFGSKSMKLPNIIQIQQFTNSDYSESAIFQPSLVAGDTMLRDLDSYIELYVFVEKAIINTLYSNVEKELKKYINPAFGFGNQESINDSIIEYIRKNIIPLYRVNEVLLFSRKNRLNNDVINTNTLALNNQEKLNAGLIQNSSFTTNVTGLNQLDFRLIYNKTLGFSEDIGLSIRLIKK